MAQKVDTEIDISVIVPVFNDAERLKLCLQALEHQTYPKERFYAQEVVMKHPARYSWVQPYKRVTRFAGSAHNITQSELSALQRLSKLIKYFGLAATPPFRSLFRNWKDERLKTRTQELQFSSASLFVRYVAAWEHIWPQLGGRSRR